MDDLKNERYCYIINSNTGVKCLIRTSNYNHQIFRLDHTEDGMEDEDNKYEINDLNLTHCSFGYKHIEYLIELLKETHISRLNFQRCSIGSDNVNDVVLALPYTKITDLDLGSLCTDEDIKFMAEILKCTQITKLNLNRYDIRRKGANHLAHVLPNTEITELDINYCEIGNEGVKYLAGILKDTQITSLGLGGNRIRNESAKYLAQVLQYTKITKLNLCHNNIEDEGLKYLTKAFQNTKITELNFDKNNIGYEGVKYLSQALQYTTITDLNLSDNRIGNEGVKYLAQGLQNTKITKLNISYNNIGNEGVKYLSQVLQSTKITELDLYNNKIEDEGAKYLAHALKDTQIISLDLGKNLIQIDGAQCLNQLFINNKHFHYEVDVIGMSSFIMFSFRYDKTFVEFYLHDSSIGISGSQYINQTFKNMNIDLHFCAIIKADDVKYLAKAFENIQIDKLTLQYNAIDYIVSIFKNININLLKCGRVENYLNAKQLASVLKEIKVLQLNLSGRYIDDEFIKYLAPFLKDNTIMYLDFRHNRIGPNGVKYLADVLPYSQILFINLRSNKINVEGAKYLAQALKYSQVSRLHLEDNNIGHEGYQYLKDAINNTNVYWLSLHKSNDDFAHVIKRNRTTTSAYKINNAFMELVSFNPHSDEFEFILSTKSDIDLYAFLIKDISKFKSCIIDAYFQKHDLYDINIAIKITEFISTIADKFNIFINDNLITLMQLNGTYNYVDLVKQFEDMKHYDIVKNLLLHRDLYYMDDRQEILHPYIYKMLHKYDMILYNKQIDANKKDEIISYYQNHLEIDGSQEIIDLLSSTTLN